MVPFPMLPTDSSAERRLYEGFLEQLDESYVVYHSVDWVLAGGVQGEADFVIAHPEAGVLVLEAKGGRISYDPARRRWSQHGRSGQHDLGEDPFHQARDEMHSLVRILEAQPGWSRWRPSYGYGVAFPDGAYELDAHPGAPARCAIDRDDMGRLAGRVAEIMAGWSRAGRRFGAEGMDAVATALGYRVEIRTPLKFELDEEDRRIIELTDEQSYLRAFVLHRRRAAVTGPAGSGKTILATEIAKHVALSGKRTLLTCFNVKLADHLRVSTEGTPNLRVTHFHGLCLELAREAGIPVERDEDVDDRTWFEERLPDALERAARALGPRFDAIVVDEAQDFRSWWWPALLSTHREPDDGPLFVFGDDEQNLYRGDGLPVAPDDVLPPLPHNLRNTRRIHEFVSVFHDAHDSRGKGPEGRAVEILDYADEDELVRLVEVVLLNLVDGEAVPLHDVVLLTPGGKDVSALWRRGRVGRFTLSDRAEAGTVLWSSVHAFKGLERPVVVLAELATGHTRVDLDTFVYTGGSRARNHLIVIAERDAARELRDRVRSAHA
ncbi:MAG: AAA family ATPase [Actinomycetota bacterium]